MKKVKHPVRRTIFTILLFLFMIPLCAGVFAVSYIAGIDGINEFDPYSIKELDQASVIYNKDDEKLILLKSDETRVSVPVSSVPKHVIDAFLAVEDTRFYEHNGIDYQRVIGSIINDIKAGSLREGASTLSQQLIKNMVLTKDKTWRRKLTEVVFAMKLEQTFSKNQILEMYLNYNYFGKGAYGIERAANVYFNKHVGELTIGESATLAGILKAPSRYSPHLHMEASISRRNLILDLMAENGFISSSVAEKEKKLPITLTDEPEDEYNFYIDMAISETCQILNISKDELLHSGLSIYTAYDAEADSAVQQTFKVESLFPPNAPDGQMCEAAFVIINNSDGSIAAIQGSREYSTRFCLNRANSIARQPGSTIKPILVYAPAVEILNFSPSTFVLDEPVNFSGYTPRDFSGKTLGWVTLRDAVAKSLNIPAVKIFNMVGVKNGKEFAANVGIPFDVQDDSLTLALGGFTTGISPLQLAGAYTTFPNGGDYTSPYSVRKILDKNGKVIYEHSAKPVNVMSAQTAYLITSMLESTVEYGTAHRLALENVTLAAKTGTSTVENVDGNSDSWIAAYSPEYTACCWLGYDRTDEDHKLPNDITGGTYPAEITKNVFSLLYQDKTCAEFKRPSGIVSVRLDKKVLESRKEAQLASAYTPEEYVLTELFTAKNAPTVFSTLFQAPFKITDLRITADSLGYAQIAFTPKQVDVEYSIMRKDLNTNETVELTVWRGLEGVAQYTDTSIYFSHTYEYYILPKRNLDSTTTYGEVGNKVKFEPGVQPEMP